MRRKLSTVVISTGLLLSGGLVGVSFGGTEGIAEPHVIELSLDECSSSCRGFQLEDPIFGRDGTAWIVVSNDALFDADGTKVGHLSHQCTVTYGRNKRATPWVCTYISTFSAGPYTEPGMVAMSGNFDFDGSTFAVTGGTGAYVNVRGEATLETVGQGSDQHEVLTLNLIP